MNILQDGGTLRLVVFETGGVRFGIPLAAADRVLRMVAISHLPGAPPAVLGVVNVHGELVAVADVCRRLGLATPTYGPGCHLLLASTARRRLALAAEEVRGVIEVPTTAIAPPATLSAARLPLAGAVGLADGIVFINDLEAFLSADEEGELARALQTGA